MAQFWTVSSILLCVTIFYSTNGERYYPDRPHIDTSNETIQTCPNGCEVCTDLRFVCHHLNITTIPQTWPVTLQYLDLSHLPIKHHFPLQGAPFKRYSQLKYLDISYNVVTSTRNTSFEGLERLEYLKWTDSGYETYFQYFSGIATGTFTPLITLKYLDLSYNGHLGLDNVLLRLRDLPRNTTLDYVDLSHSNNGDKHKNMILTYTLRASKLAVFKRLRVKVLKLDGNRISAIEGGFGGYLASVEYLSLRRNYLITFLAGIQWFNVLFMYNMKVLDIGKNAQLPVDVVPDHYKRLQQCIPFPKSLETLYVDNFHIRTTFKFYDDGACFNTPSSLHFVDMTGTSILGTGAPITGFGPLRYLSLQSARLIVTDPEAFNCKYWENIRTLLLGNIDLRPTFGHLHNDALIFQNCSTMISLDLENTKLSMLPKQTFKDMNQIQYINISGNGLTALDINLKNKMNLRLLNASYNLIARLTSSIMSQLDMIATRPNHTLIVDLQFNPLLCDCAHLEYIKWMKETKVKFHNFDEYTCLSDEETFSIETLVISNMDLKCKMKLITMTTVASGILIAILLVSIAIYAKRYRLEYLLLVSRQFAKRVMQTKKQADDYRKFRYHGFLSYSSLDDISVIIQIQKKMEEDFGLKLAIHDRDFVPGKYVIENITDFVEASRKVIILMSNNYLESRWCTFEYNLARNKRLDATYDAMVMIMLHDKEDLNKDKISSSLKSYIGQKTYLKWPKNSSQKPTFWLNLKEALDIGDIEQNDSDVHNEDTGIEDEAMLEAVGGVAVSEDDDELIDLNDSKKRMNTSVQIEAEVYDDMDPLIQI